MWSSSLSLSSLSLKLLGKFHQGDASFEEIALVVEEMVLDLVEGEIREHIHQRVIDFQTKHVVDSWINLSCWLSDGGSTSSELESEPSNPSSSHSISVLEKAPEGLELEFCTGVEPPSESASEIASSSQSIPSAYSPHSWYGSDSSSSSPSAEPSSSQEMLSSSSTLSAIFGSGCFRVAFG
ncbi:hypothetical protein WICPIJ_008550 [Wickerhamomyces pijperi]|uniref:Uncharacterized protein n=1 Tax=Wickerhamomyces pijperi TaxID=599730 RepID=A0A9P8TI72_WICPI|nr:hypothetical protein WICPIJ_008550 [Wickerhamomyces pijperi]